LTYAFSVPPTKIWPERKEDITLLVKHMLTRLAKINGLSEAHIESSAMKRICNYRFPGNIRELENTLERAVTLCEDNLITLEDLQLPSTPKEDETIDTNKPLEDYLGDIEKQAIVKALEETHWNRTAAAKKLGITFRALRYRLNKLGLD